MDLDGQYGASLPSEYVEFLRENPSGACRNLNDGTGEVEIFGESELHEEIEMIGVGSAKKFEVLKLYLSFQRDIGFADTSNPLDAADMARVAKGFVIGELEIDDYVYLDPLNHHSVWSYCPEDGSIRKLARSFGELLDASTEAD